MTGELMDSFESELRVQAQQFVFECVIRFEDYGRYKDMKGLNTGDKMAPQEAMEYFVEKAGVANFLKNIWTERYAVTNKRGKNKGLKSVQRLIRDIAWGVRIARYREIRHERKGRGWYNSTTKKLYGITTERIRQAAALAALRSVKNTLEGKGK
ncbi:hypothetical protein [Spirosoma rigui]|uniref:hypothetical protein n=1 Tax=Spirosoma rigui TaxID=564064 RepID=UPI0009B0451C|nr:hypothetical protein [Spirosoma rigui]